MRRFLSYIALGVVLAAPVHAVEPDEILADPVLEDRARDISKGLRCVVCQNQDIDSSNAGVARDLRLLVRERLVAGDTDEEVVAYVRARYGDYVLMSPPLTPATYALWFAPVVLAGLSLFAFVMVTRRRRNARQEKTLTAAEEERIASYLKNMDQGAAE
jgi:cytochrome c-type biogenesis protein CcmH